MNDFDFEELDKAVNALDTKNTEEHGPLPAAVPMTRPALAARPVSVSPQRPELTTSAPDRVAAPAASPEATDSRSPVAVSTPEKRRLSDARPKSRGSFMDIVPPNASRKTPARVGVSLQPVSKPEEIIPEASQSESKLVEAANPVPEPIVEKPETVERAPSKPAEPEVPAPAVPPKDKDVSWPDPLDFGDDESAKEPKPVQESVADKPEEKEEPSEPVSPFLAEAKVEKRPLGAFSNFRPAAEPKPIVSEAPISPESADELTPGAEGTFTEPEKAPLPPKESKPEEAGEPSKPDLHGAAMMSIPQQYHAETKSTDKTTRSVFDTKEYHPPLVEAAGHEHRGGGSMWGKLFIALVALALVAVAGYFAYIYFMQ